MKKKTKNLLVLIVLLAIIGIAVGYAALSQTLTLNGTATTKSSSDWNVHFGEISKETSASGVVDSACSLNTDKLTGTFSATLIPGGSVTYTVTVVNDGSIAAKASGNPTVELTGAAKDYFTCTVSDAPTTTIANNNSHTYTVVLSYVGDKLPDTSIEATATVNFNYVQAQ